MYKGLIEFNPGCLIPKIPEKNFWTNVSFKNNDCLITKRRKEIENYLSYINKHVHLSKNPVYNIFISDGFERYKNENIETLSFVEMCQSKFKELFFSTTPEVISSRYTKESIKKEKLRIQRIEKGTSSTIEFFQKIIENFKTKTKALKDISSFIKKLKESNFELEIKNPNEDYTDTKENLSNESNFYFSYYEKVNEAIQTIEMIFDKMKNFQGIVSSLIEIFDRKENFEFQLKKEINEDFLKSGVNELKAKVKKLNEEFYEELDNFQRNFERGYVALIGEFVEKAKDIEKELEGLLNEKGPTILHQVSENNSNLILDNYYK